MDRSPSFGSAYRIETKLHAPPPFLCLFRCSLLDPWHILHSCCPTIGSGPAQRLVAWITGKSCLMSEFRALVPLIREELSSRRPVLRGAGTLRSGPRWLHASLPETGTARLHGTRTSPSTPPRRAHVKAVFAHNFAHNRGPGASRHGDPTTPPPPPRQEKRTQEKPLARACRLRPQPARFH